jgi:O-antigen/teichoic acid export membrane protein
MTLISSFGGSVLATVIGIISVPISLNYWKVEKYGVWALIASVIVYLNVTNLGLSQSANVLVAKNPRISDKFTILKRTLRVLVISIGIGLLIFTLMNMYYKDWIMLLGKIPDNMKSETHMACVIMALFFLVNMPFGLLTSILVGFQKAYLENIFSMAMTIANFTGLLLVVSLKGDLAVYALLNGLGTLGVNIVKAGYVYYYIYRPHSDNVHIEKDEHNHEISYRHIVITALRFFWIGLAAMVVWNTDNFVISHYIGIKEIAPYSVTYKLYYILFNVIFMINGAILPLMARELGNGNWEWINRVYRSLLVLIAAVGGLTWLGGLLFYKDAIYWWVGARGYAGMLTIFMLGAYSYLLSMVNLNASIVATFNYTKYGGFVAWMEALAKISFSVLCMKYYGIAGAAIGTFMGALLVPTWIAPFWIQTRSQNRIKYELKYILRHLTTVLLPLLLCAIGIQLLITNSYARITGGIIVVACYVVLSYLIFPSDVKDFFKIHLKDVYEKILGYRLSSVNTD